MPRFCCVRSMPSSLSIYPLARSPRSRFYHEMAGALAQGTLDGWVKKQKTEPVADVSTEQTQGHCHTEADTEGTPPPTPMATDEPTQGSGSSVDTAAVAPSLKGAVFAVVGASDSPEVQLLLGAGVTVLDEYSAMMCTHLLCEDTETCRGFGLDSTNHVRGSSD